MAAPAGVLRSGSLKCALFGVISPPVQLPQGRSGRFQTCFAPVMTGAAGQSSGSRSPEAAQAAARSSPDPDSEPCRNRTPARDPERMLHPHLGLRHLRQSRRPRPVQCGLPDVPRGSGRLSALEKSRGASCGRIQGLQSSAAESVACRDPPKKGVAQDSRHAPDAQCHAQNQVVFRGYLALFPFGALGAGSARPFFSLAVCPHAFILRRQRKCLMAKPQLRTKNAPSNLSSALVWKTDCCKRPHD